MPAETRGVSIMGPRDGGVGNPMPKSVRSVARAQWGGKRYLLPLPILSLLLLSTALAAPGLLRMTVNVFDDANLTILATIQNVVHPDGRRARSSAS